MKKKSFKDALRIWDKYLAVQKQIKDSDYTVWVNKDTLSLMGNIKGKLWTAEIFINPYDRHSPHIDSEHAVPCWNKEKLWTSDLFHDRCDEALARAEEKAGMKLDLLINVIMDGSSFLPKICDAIDNYDRANNQDLK